MEYDPQNEGSLIWKVAIGTIIFTTLTSLSWHFGEMRVLHERERDIVRPLKEEGRQLSQYRDELRNGGTSTAREYLEATRSTYGF